MSRRITTKTEMTNKDLAVQALNQAGVVHEVQGDIIRLTSSPYAGVVLDLKTGDLMGDDMYHTPDKLGILRQHYSEMKVRDVFLKEGTMIDSRTMNEQGDIVLMWHLG